MLTISPKFCRFRCVRPEPVPGPLTLRLHASPDTAWSELRAFLAETQHRLTIAIYDFSARHVLRAVVEAVKDKPDASLLLVIDPGLKPEEKDVLTTLREQVPQAEVVMAATTDARTNVSKEILLFHSAFHTKVIVRDGTAFWLSSGNFSDRSQPRKTLPFPGTRRPFSGSAIAISTCSARTARTSQPSSRSTSITTGTNRSGIRRHPERRPTCPNGRIS